MRPRAPFQAAKLDIQTFIESGETLSGQADLTTWPRVADGLAEGVSPAQVSPLQWTAQGRLVPRRMGGPELWLDMSVSGVVPLTCQRCLQPVAWQVDLQRSVRFVADEQAAAELDADMEDDVLAVSRHFDLLELLEDEVVMDAPIVPRHDECPDDVDAWMHDAQETTPDGQVQAPDAEEAEAARPNPFAALAALKKKD